jgi:hypothetical protein
MTVGYRMILILFHVTMATGLKCNSKTENLLEKRGSRGPQSKSHTSQHNGADKTDAGKIDAAQEDYRLSSFEMYGIVSSILMGSSLGLISMVDFTAATPPSKEYDASQKIAWNEDFLVMCAKYVLVFAGSFSVVLGAYSTMVFNFITVYCKTALSLGREQGYLDFLQETFSYRWRGFVSFWYSINLFLICFVAWLFLHLEGPFRYICSGVVGIVVALLAYDLQCIANLASKHVFSDDNKKES